jgi:hypothetical protein
LPVIAPVFVALASFNLPAIAAGRAFYLHPPAIGPPAA